MANLGPSKALDSAGVVRELSLIATIEERFFVEGLKSSDSADERTSGILGT